MSHVVGGSLRSFELDGDDSQKDCCVTHRWGLVKLVELDGEYSGKDCCVTQRW